MAVEYLRSKGADHEAPTMELAEACGRDQAGFAQYLTGAVSAGLIARRQVSELGGAILWRLGHNADKSVPPPRPVEPAPRGVERQVVLRTEAKAANSVFAYAAQRGAAPFSVAVSTDGRLTIERHGRVICELTNAERKQVIVAAAQGVIPQ